MRSEKHLLHARLMTLTGLSMDKIILYYRCDRAAQMLRGEDTVCASVAGKVGLDAPLLSKKFKARYGILPGE